MVAKTKESVVKKSSGSKATATKRIVKKPSVKISKDKKTTVAKKSETKKNAIAKKTTKTKTSAVSKKIKTKKELAKKTRVNDSINITNEAILDYFPYKGKIVYILDCGKLPDGEDGSLIFMYQNVGKDGRYELINVPNENLEDVKSTYKKFLKFLSEEE